MSNATDIFNEAISKLQTTLGVTYKKHTNIFSTEDLGTNSLENGYSCVLLDVDERNPQLNKPMLERNLRIIVTHRTYASVDAGKVVIKLVDVYDKEAAIINDFRMWTDQSIGLIAALPKTSSKVEQMFDGEDSFIVNTINFVIIYIN